MPLRRLRHFGGLRQACQGAGRDPAAGFSRRAPAATPPPRPAPPVWLRGGELIELMAREFFLLEHLVQRASETYTRGELLEFVRDVSLRERAEIVDACVSGVCAKVGPLASRRFRVSGSALGTWSSAGQRSRPALFGSATNE